MNNCSRFIIAGAPKCGSSSLFTSLSRHPMLCPSKIKETGYFFDADYVLTKQNNYWNNGIANYNDFFLHCDSNKILYEATPDYLYQKNTPGVLKKHFPDIKIIFILRDPVDRLFSLYNYAVHSRAVLDKSISFENFSEKLLKGEEIEKNRDILNNGLLHGNYAFYLKKWIEFFPGQIHITCLEDLTSNFPKEYQKICDFLDIENNKPSTNDFDRKNITPRIRYQFLAKLGHKIKKLPGGIILRNFGYNIYKKLNYNEVPRIGNEEKVESSNIFLCLKSYYKPYIHELCKLTDKDFADVWK